MKFAASRIGWFLPSGLIAVCIAVPASAQFGGSGALGGPFASRGISRPLGGIPSPRQQQGFRRGERLYSGYGYGLPYAYSVYVPDYFSSWVDPSYAPMVMPPAPPQQVYAPPAPAAPPVVINQYFVQGGPGMPVSVTTGGNPPAYPPGSPDIAPVSGDTANAGAPLAPPENYYLIAYKNHSVYAALAYWVEGNTLNYVTTENTHNQASLDLIDIELTKNMNRTRNVPFTIALPNK